MPSKSKEQERFFNIAAHDEQFAKDHGIKPETAKEWHEADKAKRAEEEKKESQSEKKD